MTHRACATDGSRPGRRIRRLIPAAALAALLAVAAASSAAASLPSDGGGPPTAYAKNSATDKLVYATISGDILRLYDHKTNGLFTFARGAWVDARGTYHYFAYSTGWERVIDLNLPSGVRVILQACEGPTRTRYDGRTCGSVVYATA
jgi:hypothetical protein